MAKVTIELEEDAFGNAATLRKLQPGEPFWILRGQDLLASRTVRFWANEAEKVDVPDAKIANARAVAHAMLAWPLRRLPD